MGRRRLHVALSMLPSWMEGLGIGLDTHFRVDFDRGQHHIRCEAVQVKEEGL